MLAVGEAHARAGTERVRSATRRFAEEILPLVGGEASDLVTELWLPDPKCRKKTVERVAKAQAPVTEKQAKRNPNEYVTLGFVAQKLGIAPHGLVPSCDEMERIATAKNSKVELMLETVARVTERTVSARRAAQSEAGARRHMILVYGGAMHNDRHPDPAHESFAYGPRVATLTGGRYVELDLIVPEYIQDTDAWRAQPWYAHHNGALDPDRVKVYKTGEDAFAVIFARSSAAPDAGAPKR